MPASCSHLQENTAHVTFYSTNVMTGSINRSDVSIQCRSSVSSVDFLTLQNFYLHKNASKHTKGK